MQSIAVVRVNAYLIEVWTNGCILQSAFSNSIMWINSLYFDQNFIVGHHLFI